MAEAAGVETPAAPITPAATETPAPSGVGLFGNNGSAQSPQGGSPGDPSGGGPPAPGGPAESGAPADPPAGAPLLASLLQNEAFKEHDITRRYQTPDALVQGYIELEKKIGEKGVLIPGENATAEDRLNFFKQLPGFPEAPEGYGVTEETLSQVLPQGALAPSGEALNGLAQKCHEAGITAPQLGVVLEWYGGWMSDEVQGRTQDLQTQAIQQREALQQEWGANIDHNLMVAREQVRRMFGENPAFLSDMISGGEGGQLLQVGTSPEIAKVFFELAQYTGNHKLVQFGDSGLLSPAQAQEKIDSARTQQRNGEITNAQLLGIIEQYQELASSSGA